MNVFSGSGFTQNLPPCRGWAPGTNLRQVGWLVGMWLGLGLLSGCGRNPPPATLAPLPADAVVLSYVAGINPMQELYQEKGPAPVLQEILGRRVVNGGVQEELSQAARDRLPGVLQKVKPKLMILGYGMTDLRRQYDADALKDNLKAMILLAQEQNIDVVLIAMPKVGFSMKPHPLYQELAQETGAPAELDIAFELMRTHTMKGEKWTLNDAGVRRFAEAIRDLLVANGAL